MRALNSTPFHLTDISDKGKRILESSLKNFQKFTIQRGKPNYPPKRPTRAAEHMTQADVENNGYAMKLNRSWLTTGQVELFTWNFQ